MDLSVAEKIRVVLRRKGMTLGDLAEALGSSRQNLSNKMSRDNFSAAEIRAIAAALECEAEIIFRMPDGSAI